MVVCSPSRGLGCPGMVHHVGIGQRGGQWGIGKREGQKWATTFVMARFRDSPRGPPTSWAPPCVPPSYISRSSRVDAAHIPIERGGARVAGFCSLGRAGAVRTKVVVVG